MGKSNKEANVNGSLKEAIIEFTDMKVFQSIAGAKDENFKALEKKLDLKIGRDGNSLIVRGQDSEVDLASDLLSQFKAVIKNGDQIFPGDMERAIGLLSRDRKAKLSDLFRDQVRISGRKRLIVPKTYTQKLYLEAIRSNEIVFGIGPAGTGKTYLAMAMAVSALLKKEVKRVVLCRPAVEAGEKLGFLPGDMAEKVNPYLRPLYDALHDMVDYERAEELVEKGSVEVAPLAFMRGRTLSNAFVVLDEAQNTSPGQMKMLLTRLGENSKCLVTGDPTQVDLPRGMKSGLIEATRILNAVKGLEIVRFSEEDVIRHRIVADIIRAYKKLENE